MTSSKQVRKDPFKIRVDFGTSEFLTKYRNLLFVKEERLGNSKSVEFTKRLLSSFFKACKKFLFCGILSTLLELIAEKLFSERLKFSQKEVFVEICDRMLSFGLH